MTANDPALGEKVFKTGMYAPEPDIPVDHNGYEPRDDIPPPEQEWPPDDEPTTWEPVDLGPYLRGEVERPQPALGVVRADGLRLIYPGRQHVIVGETESGKTWMALASVAAELAAGRFVAYIHFEESDPGSTLERLQLLGVTERDLTEWFRFAGPSRPIRTGWLEPLLTPAPSLVVFDGVNEGMSLHGDEIKDADGVSAFRRKLIRPCVSVGAATLACDHTPHGGRVAEYGSVHKGNALDGTRINLENVEPFGRRLRGRSNVFVTKDRPGYLRAQGQPTKVPGKTFMGTLVVDDSQAIGPDFMMAFYAPKADTEVADGSDPAAELADTVHAVIAALPERTTASLRTLFAEMRQAGHRFTEKKVRDAVDDLIVAGRLTEVFGKRGAKGYQAPVTTAAEEDPE